MQALLNFYATLAPLFLPLAVALHIALGVNGYRKDDGDGFFPFATAVVFGIAAFVAICFFFGTGSTKPLLFSAGLVLAHAVLHLTIFKGLDRTTK